MLTIPVSRHIPVSAAIAWDLLVDTARWVEWGPSIGAVDVAGGRLSADSSGRVRTLLGIWVPFRVTQFEQGRRWSWSVAGIPATTHQVEPTSDGCRVTFGVPLPAAAYALVCAAALRRIERLALADGASTHAAAG